MTADPKNGDDPASARSNGVGNCGGMRVVVALSGGVDSAVSAALLVDAGHDVIGVTLQLYDPDFTGGETRRGCCAGRDIRDARNVAERLAIPHYVLDYQANFHREVIGSFADHYIGGQTPVPCAMCNQRIKFRDLLRFAGDIGASALATGHYVMNRREGDRWRLICPLDMARDQSYFLFSLTQSQLRQLMFPIGGLAKADVRRLARDYGLPVADKPASQDICFVPNRHYADLVSSLRPGKVRAGRIVNRAGEVLGFHDGVHRFTVGQRKRLNVESQVPLYVIEIRADRAEVVVGPKNELQTHTFWVGDVNWLGEGSLVSACNAGLTVYVRVRSSRPPVRARLRPAQKVPPLRSPVGGTDRATPPEPGTFTLISSHERQGTRRADAVRRRKSEPSGRLTGVVPAPIPDSPGCKTRVAIDLETAESGVAPGQACVFYDRPGAGARVLGGGWILPVHFRDESQGSGESGEVFSPNRNQHMRTASNSAEFPHSNSEVSIPIDEKTA